MSRDLAGPLKYEALEEGESPWVQGGWESPWRVVRRHKHTVVSMDVNTLQTVQE